MSKIIKESQREAGTIVDQFLGTTRASPTAEARALPEIRHHKRYL